MAERLGGVHGLAAVGPLYLRPLMILVRDRVQVSVDDHCVRNEEPGKAHVTLPACAPCCRSSDVSASHSVQRRIYYPQFDHREKKDTVRPAAPVSDSRHESGHVTADITP
jgi:hypothetical protein